MSDKVRRMVTVVADHLTLSLLWLICSLPLISAPGASAALLDAHRLRHDGDDSVALFAFINAFRRHFRRSLAIGGACAAAAGILVADFAIAARIDAGKTPLLVGLIAVALALGLTFAALFPLFVSTDARGLALIKAAVVVAFSSPLRSVAGLTLISGGTAAALAAPLVVIVIPSLVAAGLIKLFRPVTSQATLIHITRRGQPASVVNGQTA